MCNSFKVFFLDEAKKNIPDWSNTLPCLQTSGTNRKYNQQIMTDCILYLAKQISCATKPHAQ
jgi:hypothetical protein